ERHPQVVDVVLAETLGVVALAGAQPAGAGRGSDEAAGDHSQQAGADRLVLMDERAEDAADTEADRRRADRLPQPVEHEQGNELPTPSRRGDARHRAGGVRRHAASEITFARTSSIAVSGCASSSGVRIGRSRASAASRVANGDPVNAPDTAAT